MHSSKIIFLSKQMLLGASFFIFTMSTIAQSSSKPTLWANFNVEPIYDDNVYKDSRNYQDTGYSLNLFLGSRLKFTRSTFAGFYYQLGTKNFNQYYLENQNSHLFSGLFKQRLGDYFTFDLKGGAEFIQLPKAEIYNSQKIYARPTLKWYVLDHTDLEGEYLYEKYIYPDYDLDNTGSGFLTRIGQEISPYVYFELTYSLLRKDFPERYLSGIDGKIDYTVTGGSPTVAAITREDNDHSVEIKLVYDLTRNLGVELSYHYAKLNSNDNYFDWGPNQWKEENITYGDERLVENYRSYLSNTYGWRIKWNLRQSSYLDLTGYIQDKKYQGRLAKDENDKFREPEEKRKDKQIFFSLNWSKELLRNLPIGNLGLKLTYSYENNNSNDALYNYSNNIFSLSFSLNI